MSFTPTSLPPCAHLLNPTHLQGSAQNSYPQVKPNKMTCPPLNPGNSLFQLLLGHLVILLIQCLDYKLDFNFRL